MPLLAWMGLVAVMTGAAVAIGYRAGRRRFRRLFQRAQGQIWEAIVERHDGGFDWQWIFPGRSALFQDLFGAGRAEMRHPYGDASLPEKEAMDRRSKEAIESGAPAYWQEFSVERDGKTRWLQEHVTIVKIGDQRWSLVGVITDVTAMRAEQVRLREYGRMVVQTLERADCLLWRAQVRIEGQKIHWVGFEMPESRLYTRIFGKNAHRTGRVLWSLIDVPGLAEMNARSTKAILSGASGYEQEFHASRDDIKLWLHEQVSIAPADGGVLQLVGVIMDVTALHTAEEKRKTTEAQIAHLLSRADCLLWQARVVYVDAADDLHWAIYVPDSRLHQRLFGADPSEAPNLPWHTIVAPERGEAMRRLARESILSRESSYEQEIHAARAGQRFVLHERVNIQVVSDREWYLVGTVFDVTALHRAEEALAAEKERLSVTLAAMSDTVLTSDRAGVVLFANRAAGRLLGQDPERLVGRPAAEVCRLVREQERSLPLPFDELFRSDASVLLPPRVQVLANEGRRVSVEGALAPIHDAHGAVVGAVVVMRDVTERERLEEEMSRASKLQSIGLLAGGIAHDFNNLLTVILGNLVVLKQALQTEGEAAACLDEAERAVVRARDLTKQLLTFARGGDPVRTAVHLQEVITEAASFGVRGSPVRCEFDLAADLWPADVDRGQISQVVQNLVLNAVHAMSKGGIVRILARNETINAASPHLAPGRYICLAVDDSGCGIPPENIERVFDPYFTTKAQGSGLGLATVYSIIKKHRGAIDVRSRLGSGTTIRLWLPAAYRSDVARVAPAAAVAGPLHGRILLMDDEEPIRKVASRMLSRLGLAVEAAPDGASALDLFRAARECGQPFDLVMLDLTVPGGMGGMETLGKLREIDPDVRAIVSSGYSDEMAMGEYRAHGFVGMIPKPYRIEDCARILGEALTRAG